MLRSVPHVVALAALIVGLAACGESPKAEIIEWCIPLVDGPPTPVARVLIDYKTYSADQPADPSETWHFLIATELPMTTVSPAVLGDASSTDGLDMVALDLAVVDAQTTGVVGRAAFWDVDALARPLPTLGPPGALAQYDGVIGGDLLRNFVVRIWYRGDPACALPWLGPRTTYAGNTLTFYNDLPDSDSQLSSDGYGVFDFDLAGGGTLLLDDVRHNFPASRVAVTACVEPEAFDASAVLAVVTSLSTPEEWQQLATAVPVSGVDAMALVATGSYPLVMSASFVARLVAEKSDDPSWPDAGPTRTPLNLLEGQVPSDQYRLRRLALVGDVSNSRGPCTELAYRRRLDIAFALGVSAAEVSDTLTSRGAAVAELDATRGATDLLAYGVADETALFAGLRAELAGAIPSVDLLVGSAWLSHFELWLDYPDNRLILRCKDYQTGEGGSSCGDLSTGGSCCEWNNGQGGPCHCVGSPCCQYYRWLKP